MLSIDTVIVADAWLEFNGCVVWEDGFGVNLYKLCKYFLRNIGTKLPELLQCTKVD